jgi:hypothetical protein
MANKSIPFKAITYKNQRRFTVPIEVVRQLGLEGKPAIHLVLKSTSGKLLFKGMRPMKSRHEIYGRDLKRILGYRQKLSGRASRP